MRRWLQPARALPVTLRPVGGETVNSYALRLSAANGLVPTAVLRSLGQITQASGHHLLARDSWLNDQALDRLEALSAISRSRLVRALPALQQRAPSFPVPGVARRPARPALLRSRSEALAGLPHLHAARVPRHHADGHGQAQCVPAGLPPPALARNRGRTRRHRHRRNPRDPDRSRRLQRLRSNDSQLADDCVQAAWNITRVWAREPHCRPRLRARWQARAVMLGPGTALSSRAVTFSEAVALAEILTDPGWRHHVATAPRQDDQFYRRIAARLSEGPYRPPTTRSSPGPGITTAPSPAARHS